MVSRRLVATGATAALFLGGCSSASGAGEQTPLPSPDSTYEQLVSPVPTFAPTPSPTYESQSPEPGVVQGEQTPQPPSAPEIGGCATSTEVEFTPLNDFYLLENVGDECVVVINQYDQPAGSVGPGEQVRVECDNGDGVVDILWPGGPASLRMDNPHAVPEDVSTC